MYSIEKEDFNKVAAALAHEVKNPLALIKANVEILEEEVKSEQAEKLSIIKKQLDKISCIISDFIQLVKPVNKADCEKVFIYDLINDIIEDYDISLKGKEILFEIHSPNEEVYFWGNYTKLSILFFNIFKNAVEAIKSKGRIITDISKKDNLLTIKIADNGSGLDSEIKDRLFEPFVTTKKYGSGLGLSICKNIAQEYKGDFKLQNCSEGGCEAIVTLLLSK